MTKTGGIEASKLKSFIERIERLESEKSDLAHDIRDVYAEAKAFGYDTKIMRKVIRLRAVSAQERAEEEYLLDTYKRALGMQMDLFDEAA